MESASRPGLLRRAYYRIEAWFSYQSSLDHARQVLREPTPEQKAEADRYWKQQAKLPMHQRSLGWWTENGIPTIVVIASVVVVAVLIF